MGDYGCDDVLESTHSPRAFGTGRRGGALRGLWSRACRFGGPVAITLIVGIAGGGFVGALGESRAQDPGRAAGDPPAAAPARAVAPPPCRDTDVWKTVDTSVPAVPPVPGGAKLDVQIRARFVDGRLLGLCAWCAVRQDPARNNPAATLAYCALVPAPAPPRDETPPAINPDPMTTRLDRIRQEAWTAPAAQAELRASCDHAWQAQAEVNTERGPRTVHTAGYRTTCAPGD
ncbi:hypothetical protein G5C51_31210 [Streptomyces sp. A7024]|uniref:Uncharacterized protein n=1 Tax=Streptomyces coryli TaxID=1128680 RepID=A0A6G4U7Y9_9ACTN|nr:hypothetical protein [Streptomyces coryli]NGN68355.1 hypothetical protein [Streptomyces coryli]